MGELNLKDLKKVSGGTDPETKAKRFIENDRVRYRSIEVGKEYYFVQNNNNFFLGRVETLEKAFNGVDVGAIVLENNFQYKAGVTFTFNIHDNTPWKAYSRINSKD